MSFDPKLMRQHFNARIYRAFCRYIEVHHPEVDINKLCEDAGLNYEYLLSEDNWVSVVFARRFTLLAIERTGDPKISFHAGRQTMSAESIGDIIFRFISKNLRISTIYKNLVHLTGLFTKVTRVELVSIERQVIRLTLSVLPEGLSTDEERQALRENLDHVFDNTLAYYSAIPNLHHLPAAAASAVISVDSAGWPSMAMELRYLDQATPFSVRSVVSFSSSVVVGILLGRLLGSQFWQWVILGSLIGTIVVLYQRVASLQSNLQEGTRALDHQTGNYAYVQREREAASRFVPWQFVKLLGHKNLSETKLDDIVETEMTVMFCDLKNFSPLAEAIGPVAVHQHLNRYFSIVGRILRRFDGQEVQYAGDEVLVVFQDAQKACLAALAIQRALEHEALVLAREKRPPMEVTMGINSGRMTLGAIGYDDQMRLSVISDHVNIAKRLQVKCRELGTSILVGQSTWEKVGSDVPEIPLEFVATMDLKGKVNKVDVYQLTTSPRPTHSITNRTRS